MSLSLVAEKARLRKKRLSVVKERKSQAVQQEIALVVDAVKMAVADAPILAL